MFVTTRTSGSEGVARRLLGIEPAALALCLLAFVVTAAILFMQVSMREGMIEPNRVDVFYRLFLFEDFPASFLFMAALLIAPMPAAQLAAGSIARSLGYHPVRASAACCVAFAVGSLWVYHAHPLSMDEAAPYMQAKIFAQGTLVGAWPTELLDWLVPANFQNYFIHISRESGANASSYWPGFALLLTPFMAAGVPWLCNPVLGATSVWVIHRLTLRLTNSVEAAGAAALFSIASAAFVIDSLSFYSMTAHLLCNAIFALLLLNPTPRRCLLAGLIGGLALTLHNPVPHMLFALPWLIWLAIRQDRWTLLPSIAAGYLPWIVVVGFGWSDLLQGMVGHPPGPQAITAGGGLFQSALTRLGNAFTLPGLIELENRAITSAKLWLWASPFLIVLAAIGFSRNKSNTHFRLLMASAAITFVGYLFVPLSQGHGWGYRYFHSAWFVLPILAASVLTSTRGEQPKLQGSDIPGRLGLGGAVAGLLMLTPWFAWQVHSFIGAHLAQLPRADRGEPRVLIIDPAMGYHAQDLVQNDPFLRGQVRMITRGRAADEQMMAKHFPNLVELSRTERGTAWGVPNSPLFTRSSPARSAAQRIPATATRRDTKVPG